MADQKKTFESFYHQHLDKVYRFVFFRVGGNHELAEDLVSEIFIKALGAFSSYDETRSRSGWILTIARNHLANFFRDRREADPLPEDAAFDEDAAYSPDAIWLKKAMEHWRKDEARRQAYELLARLPEDDRELVTFHYLFGYSYSEIAAWRGATETAVKVAAHRAIKKLRALL